MKKLPIVFGAVLVSLFLLSTGCKTPLDTAPPSASISSQTNNTVVWGQDFEVSVIVAVIRGTSGIKME